MCGRALHSPPHQPATGHPRHRHRPRTPQRHLPPLLPQLPPLQQQLLLQLQQQPPHQRVGGRQPWAAVVVEAAREPGIPRPAQTTRMKPAASAATDCVAAPGPRRNGCSTPPAQDPPSPTRPVAQSRGASPSSCPPFCPATLPHRPVGGHGKLPSTERAAAVHPMLLQQPTVQYLPVLVVTGLAAAATASAP